MSSPLDPLLAHRSKFKAFLISRLGSEADADDVLQNGLLKALRSAARVRDEEKLTAWFYQILRNAMIDHMRSRQTTVQRDDAWSKQSSLTEDPAANKAVCGCFEALLDELKSREAELLRRVELNGEAVAEVAVALGMSANNASVTLHRARKALRDRLTHFCGECAASACLDCDCAPSKI